MGDSQIILSKDIIKKTDIDDCNFFRSIISRCYEYNLINENKLESIGYDREALLKTILTYYTKNQSSSVMIEEAENILKNIDYTIGVYLRDEDNIENILKKLENETMEFMFTEGRKKIKIKFENCRKILKYIQTNKIECRNFSYDDTIDYGLSLFFKCYDDLFKAHETPGSIDYQLCIDVGEYSGILYMEKYLSRLKVENEFCRCFSIENIMKLLKGYDEKSEFLLINVFELVLINALGLMLCNKLPYNLNITESDRNLIEKEIKGLSKDELEEKLLMCAKKLRKILFIQNEHVMKYITDSIEKISSLIYERLKINKLYNVFISFKEYDEKIKYIDKEKMNNKKFRKITDDIRNCNDIKEKINIINNNIFSLADLNDMLCAECLFGHEYKIYFNTLTNIQISLLNKYIEEFGERNEWTEYFFKFIEKLDTDKKSQINNMKDKIEIEG